MLRNHLCHVIWHTVVGICLIRYEFSLILMDWGFVGTRVSNILSCLIEDGFTHEILKRSYWSHPWCAEEWGREEGSMGERAIKIINRSGFTVARAWIQGLHLSR